MKLNRLSLIAGALLVSCNLTESVKSPVTGPKITPRLSVVNGTSLPVTDSVHVKVWSTTPATIWYEKTLPWSAKFVVISGVPAGTAFTLAMEGRAKQPDSSQAVWWRGSQTGTASQPQTVDAQVLTVPVTVRDTVAPKITALSKDTALDSAVAGVRLRWRVTDDSLATVTLGTKSLTPASDIVSDSVTVAVGGSTKAILKAVDKSGNVSLSTITVSRKATSGIVVTSGIAWNNAIKYDTLTDSRDGQKYRTVKIGTQTWMAQNLNYAGKSNDTGVCYNNSTDSCAKYGRLYTWKETMAGASSSSNIPSGVQGVCPTGWHVPSDGEWTHLTDTILSAASAGTALKSAEGWINSGNGSDIYGFRFLPAGFKGSDNLFYSTGSFGHPWTSTENTVGSAWDRHFSSSYGNIYRGDYEESGGLSLRCVKDTVIKSDTLSKPIQVGVPSGVTGFEGAAQLNIGSSCSIWPANHAFTIEYWVRPNSRTFKAEVSTYQGVAENRNLSVMNLDTGDVRFRRTWAGGFYALHPDINLLRVSDSDTLSVGDWHHAAFVYTGSEGIIYLDGREKARKLDANSMLCGSSVSLNIEGTNATVDNIRISDIARYSATFTPPSNFSSDTNGIIQWTFDSTDSTARLTDEIQRFTLVSDSKRPARFILK